MTMQPAADPRLSFDMADRLRRALRVSNLTSQEMADHLEVSRTTISNWINGRAVPRPRDIRDFALKTGVPREWLESGAMPGTDPNGTQQTDGKITFRLLASSNVTELRPAA